MIRLIIENMKKVITKKAPKLAVKKEVTEKVKVKEVIPCSACNGRGLINAETLCSECEGSGTR